MATLLYFWLGAAKKKSCVTVICNREKLRYHGLNMSFIIIGFLILRKYALIRFVDTTILLSLAAVFLTGFLKLTPPFYEYFKQREVAIYFLIIKTSLVLIQGT